MHRFAGEDGGDTPAAEQVAFLSTGNVGVPGAARVHADGRAGTVWGGSMLLNRNVRERQDPAGGVLDADCARFAEAPRLIGRHAEGVAGVAVAVRAPGDVLLVAVRVAH